MSSSMKNAAKAVAKPHRERGQLQERKKLGMLEKHKDYSKRAKDYNKKKAQLKSLRQKAADRNEDEFYFGMMSRSGPGSTFSRGKRGFTGTVDGDRGNKAMSVETVRLLKTQDMQYIRTMRNVAAKDVKALEERVILAGAQVPAEENDDDKGEEEEYWEDEEESRPSKPVKPKKIVFLGDVEERDQAMNGPEDEDMADEAAEEDDASPEADEKSKNLEKLRQRLREAKRKLKALADAEQALGEQRARMAKTATYGGVTKSGKKIKIRERKR